MSVADGFVGEELIPQGRPSALITSVADRFLLREREAIMMHPVLVTIGSFTLYSYGGALMLSFLAATCLAIWLGKKRGYDNDSVIELMMGVILSGIVGCRLGFVIQNVPYYFYHPLQAINLREGGMTITGGIVFSVMWLLWSLRKLNISILNVYDFIAAPVILGMALGRIGCLLHGCCFGEMCDLPWGITYPAGTLPHGMLPGPRHPSQIYELLMDLVLLAYLLKRFGKIRYAGELFFSFFFGYGIIRFLDEMTRFVDTPMGIFNLYQWIALGFGTMGGLGLLGLFGKRPTNFGFLPSSFDSVSEEASSSKDREESLPPAHPLPTHQD
jgi:phosphatidylglycerol:prolipoprotein diacylglycerol transferase